jgi:hypothetical protein
MSTRLLCFDAIRRCEAEIWRVLSVTLQTMCVHWAGSDVARKALERVSAVIDEQAKRNSAEKGGEQWTH